MLSINTDGIKNKFKPAIKNSINNLESAESILSSINIPSDFTYRTKLRNTSQNVASIKGRVANIRNWVDKSISDFNNAESKNNNIIDELMSNISKFEISSVISDNISKTNIDIDVDNLIQEGKKQISQIGNDIIEIIEQLFGFTGAISYEETENAYSPVIEEDLDLTASEVIGKSEYEGKLLDDPEIQEDLRVLNSILEFQKLSLTENAEGTKEQLAKYNPDIKNLTESGYSFEEPKDIATFITYLQNTVNAMKKVSLEGTPATYNPEGSPFVLTVSWYEMQKYAKENNLTWDELILEYEETINTLTIYKEDLENRRSQIYQLERYIELYPYTKITLREDFEEYLERDYSDEGKGDWWSTFLEVITFGLIEQETRYDELTPEEKAVYFYIKEKYSEEEAEEYFDCMEDLRNQRKGQEAAFEYIKDLSISELKTVDGLNNFLLTTGMGLKDGVWTFGENLYNLFSDNGEIMSETQYKQAILTMMLTQEFDLKEIEKEYGKDSEEYKVYKKLSKLQPIYRKALGVNYNTACQIGELAIPIAVSYIPVVGKAAGIALEGLSDAGAAKTVAYQNGITGWDAYLYMGIRGVTSALTTKYFKAIPGLSDNASITFKGILKGSLQAGLSAVAQSKIDIFVTKMFTGETIEIEEFFDLEQDAMTFATALCTAFVLNGGKALIVKYKGQKVTITAEDVEKAMNEDGTIDVDKLLGYEMRYFDKVPISKKINDVKNILIYLSNNELKKYNISRDRIDDIINNRMVIMTEEGFKKELIERKKGSGVGGFYDPTVDKIYIPETLGKFSILHECLHALGSVKENDKKNVGINEAFTDYLANKYSKEYAKTSYYGNARALETIINGLEKCGYNGNGLAEDAYFNKNPNDFEATLDKIAGKGFYREIGEQMTISIDQDKSSSERRKAQIEVSNLAAKFTDSANKYYKSANVSNNKSTNKSNNESYYKQIDGVVSSINNKYKGQGRSRLEEYVRTGNSNVITRDGNARSIIESIPKDVIKEYLKTYK